MGNLKGNYNRPETKIRDDLVEYLVPRGWLVEVTHGNAYQTGFPDLLLAHPRWGQRWVDVKVKGRYSFTKAQKIKWPIWERHGIGIWILVAATQEEYDKLFGPPNWRDYWKDSWGELPDIDALVEELRRGNSDGNS